MPIYEFYCEKCNTVFNFFSRSVNTAKVPACPKCRRPLTRQMSLFAKVSRGKEEPAGEGMPQLMILNVDQQVPEETMNKLRAVPGVMSAKLVTL